MRPKENERTRYDLIVIGGGSAGFAAAIQAHELCAEVALVNTDTIGGTCVNVGCVPSKTLIRAAEAHHRPTAHGFAGIQVTSRAVDFQAVTRQKDELVDSLRRAKYVDVLEAYEHIHLIEGAARFRSAQVVEVNGAVLEAPRIIAATGSQPWMPAIPGLLEFDPLTSTSAFELDHLPRHKDWIFLAAVTMLVLHGVLLFRPKGKAACSMTGGTGCETAGRFTKVMFWVSLSIVMVGAFFAYALVPILRFFEG